MARGHQSLSYEIPVALFWDCVNEALTFANLAVYIYFHTLGRDDSRNSAIDTATTKRTTV